MSIQLKYPDVRPKGLLNFISGRKDLPISIDFARASTGTYVDVDGLIKEAPIDAPRFTYNSDLTFKGLIKEPASTNLQQSSSYVSDATPHYRVYGTETLQAAPSPTGAQTATDAATQISWAGSGTIGFDNYGTDYGNNAGATQVFSVFVKPSNTVDQVSMWFGGKVAVFTFATETFSGVSPDIRYGFETYKDGWYRLWVSRVKNNQYWYGQMYVENPAAGKSVLVWGVNLVNNQNNITSYINNINTVAGVTRAAETLKVVGLDNYSDGFSILLDCNTNKYVQNLYEVEDSANATQSSLTVSNGSLVWTINGVSNQSSGEYPQVGYVQGRFRSLACYNSATGANVVNMLYTSTETNTNEVASIAFPTTATVLPNANKLELGDFLFIKALYFWNEKLDDAQAMSIVKGDQGNIVTPEANIANATIIIYDTDPTNVGETDVTLDIKGTTTVETAWGDGKSTISSVAPLTHSYPYAGKYKIQLETPDNLTDGYTTFNLETPTDTTLDVLQWGAGYKPADGGSGFTGAQMKEMFRNQPRLASLPAFKYTDLTDLDYFMSGCTDFDLSDTAWVPTTLPQLTTAAYAFNSLASTAAGGPFNFPKLTTGSNFQDPRYMFAGTNILRFDNSNTGVPFTNVDGVVSWQGMLQGSQIQFFGPLNYSANNATSMFRTFYTCNDLQQWAAGDTSSISDMRQCWGYCSSLTTFPAIDVSSVSLAGGAWRGCATLTNFPDLDFSNAGGVQLDYAWDGCTVLNKDWSTMDFSNVTNLFSTWTQNKALTGPAGANAWWPNMDFSNVTGSLGSPTNITGTWYGCNLLSGAWPFMDFSNLNGDISGAWAFCTGITSFPGPLESISAGVTIDFSNVTSFGSDNQGAWQENTGLNNFPMIDTSSATSFVKAWQQCSNINNVTNGGAATSFPLIDTSQAITIRDAWNRCTSMTVFPAINTSNVTGPLGTPSSGTGTWRGFNGVSFPALDLSNVEGNVCGTFCSCSNLATVPDINFAKASIFGEANQGIYQGCSSLTTFPVGTRSQFRAGVKFVSGWLDCSSLANWQETASFHVPGGPQVTYTSDAFQNAFKNCALTAQSIENILVSLDANGSTGVTLNINGGTNTGAANWTAAANAAYNNLITKGWTIVFNP